MGGGKSKALRMEAFATCLETPGTHALLMRRTFPELEQSHVIESLKEFPRSICRYNEIKHRWTIQTSGEPSYLWFGFARTEHDIYQYMSSEFQFIGVDELTHFTWQMIRFLFTRLRGARPGVWCRFRGCSNPGNIGHGWVRDYFGIGKCVPDTVWTPEPTDEDPQPMSRAFLPATIFDNPHLILNDPNYIKRLSTLPPTQRKMFLEGDWENFEGRFFAEFSVEHLCKPFDIPSGWKVYRAIDYGFAKPFCCLWIAAAPDGHYYAFRELYLTGIRDGEQAKMISKLSKEVVEYTVGDPSMKADRGQMGGSAMENYLKEADIAIVPGDNERIPGWMAVRNLLAKHPDGTPVLRIFEDRCPNLRRELEEAIASDNRPEDVNTDIPDHAIDALRYFSMSRPSPTQIQTNGDPYAHMPAAEQREWKALAEMARKIRDGNAEALLHDLNRD